MRRYTAAEKRTRDLVLERDGYRCVCPCARSIVGEFYSLGHRLREGQGGKYTPVNLLTFQGTGSMGCHARIDQRRDPSDEANGYTVRSWQDPASVPVLIHGTQLMWLTPDGRYSTKAPAGAA